MILRILFLLAIELMTLSCNEEISHVITLSKKDRVIVSVPAEPENQVSFYHFYFENIQDHDRSCGFNLNDASNDLSLKLFPGKYNLYVYGLIYKTNTSFKVHNYYMKKNLIIPYQELITLKPDPITLIPEINLIKNVFDQYVIQVKFGELIDIFSLSSISLKQGTDKNRSLDTDYIEDKKLYQGLVPFYAKGSWLLNVSYTLKSKRDQKILDYDQLFISTSNFTNIDLGYVE